MKIQIIDRIIPTDAIIFVSAPAIEIVNSFSIHLLGGMVINVRPDFDSSNYREELSQLNTDYNRHYKAGEHEDEVIMAAWRARDKSVRDRMRVEEDELGKEIHKIYMELMEVWQPESRFHRINAPAKGIQTISQFSQ